MKVVIHRSWTRGQADHGWLKSFHSFSFAGYQNPERVQFGALRVLNDDEITGGRGFGTHPHDNMEIISIPLEGALEHKDSMGNVSLIKAGEIQAMSAGTGIFHSEFNKSETEHAKFLQIWVFPNKRDVEPRYDQLSLKQVAVKNDVYQVLSPDPEDDGLWIHQDAWFSMADYDEESTYTYRLKSPHNGVYIFVLEGIIHIDEHELRTRDGIGISAINSIEIQFSANTKVLLMDIPMV